MSVHDIYRGADYAQIQAVFDTAVSNDTICFHNSPSNAAAFDVGQQTIKIKNGSSGAPFKIKIVGDNKPVIQGTSFGLLDPNGENCGIFYIGPWCSVDIRGLHLLHQIPNYGPGQLAHGSATIANLVDNKQESYLDVSDCEIETNATTAISVRSNSALIQSVAPGKHDVTVRDCAVTGRTNAGGYYSGNYSSLNLGFWGKAPLDMRAGSRLEVKNCTLNSLFLGVAVWNVLSDLTSTFQISENRIGTGNNDGTALGVSLICKQAHPTDPIVLPKGNMNILDNTMKIGKYLKPAADAGAVGVLVRVGQGPKTKVTIRGNGSVPETKVTIRGNDIDMELPPPDTTYKYMSGIVYEQIVTKVESPDFVESPTADIKNNAVYTLPTMVEPVELARTGD